MKEQEMASARYDGVADWYDEHVAWSTAAAAPLIARLAGRGSGLCLDVGCGTGVHLAALAEAGWSVVGVDASADQLRVARRRAGLVVAGLVQADGARLPFPAVPARWWCRPSPTPMWRTSRAWLGRPAASWR